MPDATAAAKLLKYGEEERRRLARELHDDISQRLALLADDALKLKQQIKLRDDADVRSLDDLIEQARTLSEDLRRISHALHPAIIEDLGITVALQSLVRDFAERTGLPAAFAGPASSIVLSSEASGALYRILQEALRNISKHAAPSYVDVRLSSENATSALLEISDNGRGFETTSPAGLGLVTMKERADLAGGSFHLESAAGRGTRILVRVPARFESLTET